MTDNTFHTKYRPTKLSNLIGHEEAVTRLKGLVASGKIPNALLITGPSSVGKTTLARALTADINGLATVDGHPDYMEIDTGSQRTIEDVRNMIQTAKYKPRTKRRVIVLDEAQAILSNAVAATALLKPIEDAGKSQTLWILCSMDPHKFKTGNGLALAKRCTQFVLEPHTSSDLLKQAVRIVKAEEMTYLMDEEKKLLKKIVRASSGMRDVANLLQAAQQYYDGLDKKPKKLDEEHISSILTSTEDSDDGLAVTIMSAVYAGQFKVVQRSLLDVQDGFGLINKLLWTNSYVMNSTVLDGTRHRKVWGTPSNIKLASKAKELKVTLGTLAACNETLVEVKGLSQQFATSPEELLSAKLYRLIKTIHSK